MLRHLVRAVVRSGCVEPVSASSPRRASSAASCRAAPAAALPQGDAPPRPSRSSTQFTLRREEAGGAELQRRAGRARAGDCAWRLAFVRCRDPLPRKIRRSVATRGLCHENLGHPFPAIDDYRIYLTARPEAPDADQIRQRLAALEEQTGTGGPSPRFPVRAERDEEEEKQKDKEAPAEASGGFSFAERWCERILVGLCSV